MTTDTEALICDCPAKNMPFGRCCKLEPLAALRAAFESTVSEWGWDTYRNKAGDYATTPTNGAWAGYQAGHAAAKAETADVGEPMAMVQCHGSAAHPLYTADQLAAAVAAERERAATVVDEKIGSVRKANPGSGGRINSAVAFALDALGDCADAIRAGAKEASDA